jgi:ABC-type phosphate transport system ATPase subunit
MVSHNMRQVDKVLDHSALMLPGDLVEHVDTRELFFNPRHGRTGNCNSSRFGWEDAPT